MTTCRNGHEIRGPQDRRSNGSCVVCSRSNEQRYREACRHARLRLKEIQALASLVVAA